MAANRSTWRNNQSRDRRQTRSERIFGRLVMVLLIAACVSLFLYVVFSPNDVPQPPQTRIVAISIKGTDSRLIRRLPYPDAHDAPNGQDAASPETAAPKQRLKTIRIAEMEAARVADLAEIEAIEKDLHSPDRIGNEDALIVLIRAEGVTDLDDKPRLLCSGFEGRDRDLTAGTVRFEDLLKTVARKGRSRTRLIICDYGSTNIVPSLGLFDNRFAQLVEEEVKRCKQPVYVLLSHDRLQRSQIDHASRGSLISVAVANALHQPAPSGPDPSKAVSSVLTLRKFIEEVCDHCVSRSPGHDPQTPVLLRSGTGRIEPADIPEDENVFLAELVRPGKPPAKEKPPATGDAKTTSMPVRHPSSGPMLLSVNSPSRAMLLPAIVARQVAPAGAPQSPKPTSREQPAAAAAIDSTPAATAPALAAPTVSGDAGAKSEVAPQPKAPPSIQPPAAPVPEDRGLAASFKAWEARDRLLSRTDSRWSPVDFSPLAFREVERELCRQDLLLWMTTPRKGMAEWNESANNVRSEAIDRLVELEGDLTKLGESMKADADNEPSTRPGLGYKLQKDWREFRRERAELVDQQLKMTAGPEAPVKARETLAEAEHVVYQIPALIDWVNLSGLSHVDVPPGLEFANKLCSSELVRNWPSIWKASAVVTTARLLEVQRALQDSRDPLHRAQATISDECDLVLKSLVGLEAFAVGTGRRVEILLSTPMLSSSQRQALLVKLNDRYGKGPESADNAGTKATDRQEGWRPSRAEQLARLQLALLSAAQDSPLSLSIDKDLSAFGKSYRTLRSEMQENRDLFANRHFLGLACDLELMTDPGAAGDASPILPAFLVERPPIPEQLIAEIVGASEVYPPLATGDAKDWKPISVHVRRSGSGLGPLTVSAGSLSHADVDVRFVDHDPDQPLLRTLPASETDATINLEVRSTRLAELWSALPLPIAVRSTAREAVLTPAVYRPTRNDVAISLRGALNDERFAAVFPSGPTEVYFLIKNQSGRPVELDVELREGALSRPEDGPVVLAGRMKLEVGEQAVAPLKPPAPAPAPGAPAAAPPASDSPRVVDVSGGWTCTVREAAPVAGAPLIQKTIHVPLVVLHPRTYVDAEAMFDADGRRVVTSIRRRSAKDAREIAVELVVPEDFTGESLVQNAKIKKGVDQASVEMSSAPGKKQVFEISVDGYPRAFHFEVDCEDNSRTIPNEDFRSVRFVMLSADQQPLAYQVWDDGQVTPRLPEEKVETKPSEAEAKLLSDAPTLPRALFRASGNKPMPTLFVAINADVPYDFEEGVSLELSRNGQNEQHVTSDRRKTVLFQRVLANGALVHSSAVADWVIPVSLGKVSDVEFRLTATLEAANNPQWKPIKKEVLLFIDGKPPALDALNLRGQDGVTLLREIPGNPDERFGVDVRVDETGSGVGEVTFAFEVVDGPPPEKYTRMQLNRQLYQAQPLTRALAKLEEGSQYRLLVKAVDLLGNATEERSRPYRIGQPATKPMDPSAPAPAGNKGTITGVVKFGTVPRSGIAVSILGGTADQQATSGSGGRFEIKNVPKGTYTLSASVFAQGGIVKGKVEGAQPALPGQPETAYELILSK